MELQKLYVTLALDATDFKAGMATVTGIVAAGAIAASAAVAMVAIDGVKAAKDMEEQMSGIAAIFSTTVDEIQPLGDLIKDLGLNPNLKVNATEAADAIEMLGKNGLTMAEILDGAAESTVLLANSTGADFATAANIGTDAMSLFNIEAADMNEAVDGITAVTVNSKFGINDYALALAQGGGVASSVGVTFEDFNTIIAGIGATFASGSDAGTSLKTMLLRLNPATDAAADAMAELGLITEDGGSAFFDAEGNMKSMADVAGLMDMTFGDLSDAQRISSMQTIFGSDAMRAATGIMKMGEEGFTSLADTMSQTDAWEAAATRVDNVAGAMEILQGIVEAVQLSIGLTLLPILRLFIDHLIALASDWIPKIEAALKIFSDVITTTFQMVESGNTILDSILFSLVHFGLISVETGQKILVIRDAVLQLWEQIVTFLTPIWEAIAAFVSWKDVLIAVGIAITVTVVPIILGLIVALAQLMIPILAVIAVVALLRHAWEADFAGMRDFAAGVWDTIQQVFSAFRALFQGNVDSFLQQIGAAWQTGITALATFVGNLWSEVQPHLLAFWANFKAWFASIDWGLVGETILKAIGAYIKLNANIIKWVINALADLAVAIFEWAKTVDWGALAITIMETTSDVLGEFWDWIVGDFEALFAAAADWFNSVDWPALGKAIMDGVARGIVAGASAIVNAAKSAAKAALDAAKAILGISSPSKVAQDEIGLQFSTGIALGIVDGIGAIMQAINEVAGMVEVETISKFADAANKVFSMIGAAIDATRQLSKANFPEIVQGWHLREQMVTFRKIVATMMREFELIAGDMDEEHSKTLTAFAKAADAIFGLVEDALAGAVALSEFDFAAVVQKWHLRDQIIIFRRIVATVMRQFALAAAEMEEGISKEVGDFAKAAGDLFDIIEVALAGAIALSKINFARVVKGFHLRDQIIIFRNIVRTMIREFAVINDEFGTNEATAIAALAENINTFITNLEEIIDGVFIMLKKLGYFVNARIPAGLRGITTRMIQVLHSAVNPARMVGIEIGTALIDGMVSAIVSGFDQVQTALNDMTLRLDYQPPQPQAAFAGGSVGGGGRTVVIERGAFNVAINNDMDAEEFEFRLLEKLRELTDG